MGKHPEEPGQDRSAIIAELNRLSSHDGVTTTEKIANPVISTGYVENVTTVWDSVGPSKLHARLVLRDNGKSSSGMLWLEVEVLPGQSK